MRIVHKDYDLMVHDWRCGRYLAVCDYVNDFAGKYFEDMRFGTWFRIEYCNNRWYHTSHAERAKFIEKYLREQRFKRSHLFPGMFK